MFKTICSGTAFALLYPAASLNASALFDEASAQLTTRNYFFSREFSDIVGNNPQHKSQEWAQGFILHARSGYESLGPVQWGVDVLGLWGLKLDSTHRHANTGLLPVNRHGDAESSYGRFAPTLKLRYQQTELRIGELQPNLPILLFSDIRLLPPSYQGVSVQSTAIPKLTLQAGHLTSTSLRNQSGHDNMVAMLGHVPQFQAHGSAFNYAGGDYQLTEQAQLSAWYGQLREIYQQSFVGYKQQIPFKHWRLGINVGYYHTQEQGQARLGNLDNQALFTMLSAHWGGHSAHVGYQAMFGDSPFVRIFANASPLGNEAPTYKFSSTQERSWQIRYEYDFAANGLPGLTSSVRYIRGSNVKTQLGFRGKDQERDIDLGYVMQSGPLQGLGVRLRNAKAWSTYRSDINENRLIFSYTWQLL